MRRYRIGLTVGNKTADYPRSLRMGIQNTIEEAGHILVAISDLIPTHTTANGMAYYRMAFEIAARLDLDALIVPIGSVTAHLSGDTDKALDLLQTMSPSNTIVLERKVDGFRCITKDNAPGMHECMRYLIETCGFTKIAFVSGPKASQGAREREGIYFEEMAAHGLEAKPSLFARGLYTGLCPEVIEKVIADNPDLEAIACACDFIAYTAYEVMHNHKLSVGEDIAITGFDDHPRSAHLDPPLSTVHMTGYDYGCMAAREALRLCAGEPQQESVLSSTFVPRCSCGEGQHGDIDRFRMLLRQKPFPADELVSIMVNSTISMAGPRITEDFRKEMTLFVEQVRLAYLRHRANPHDKASLFSSQDLSALFLQEYDEYLSLEGFHAAAIMLLEALMEESPDEDLAWVVEQISHLHLRVARLHNSAIQTEATRRDTREWTTFHMVDDALRENGDPATAYRLMLGELSSLGVREADLFLLPEPVEFVGAGVFALSDRLTPIGSLSQGAIQVDPTASPVELQQILDHVLCRYDPSTTVCTVGGIVAGNELLGLAVLDAGALDNNGQLMAFLNLGFALKHLQMIADQREMNELLSKSNVMLEEQSQHDELTGLLNRRGFNNRIGQCLREHMGSEASVLYLDLDGLKYINDTHGHDAGDVAIQEAARILHARLPKGGLLARLGGDEFIAFVPLSKGGLDRFIESTQQDMDSFNAAGTTPFTLSISFGSSSFVIDHQTSAQLAQRLTEADEQLYIMKRQHKKSRRYQA